MSFQYRPYVSAAERRRMGAQAASNLSKRTGRPAAPIRIEGRAIAKTFWGQAWCRNLEAYSDYANRLPRGRTYARNGSVVDLHITTGKIEALVQGSSLYRIEVTLSTLAATRWAAFKKRSAGQVTNLIDLLQGRLSKEILADLTHRETGLFPAPAEIRMKCSCPDWAGMCKHLAAVLYGVGARLDDKPELFFTLRGVDVAELIASATATAAQEPAAGAASPDTALEGEDLSALFGVELDSAAPAVPSKPVASANAAAPAAAATSLATVPRTTRPKAHSRSTPTPRKPASKGKARTGTKKPSAKPTSPKPEKAAPGTKPTARRKAG